MNHKIMGLILRAMRVAHHLERRFFKARTPHWFRDTVGLLSYFKPLKYLPTFAAILLVPSHFFRRVPRILAGASTPYMTPIGFFSGSIALSLVAGLLDVDRMVWLIVVEEFLATHGTPPAFPAGPYLAVLLWISSPVWLAIMSLLLFIPLGVAHGLGYTEKIPDLCVVPLAPSTYREMVWQRLFWNSLYFGVYFLPILPVFVVGVLSAVNTPAVGLYRIGPVRLWQMAATLGGVAWIVVRPYVSMLRASVRMPTRLMLAVDVEEVAAKARSLSRFPSEDSANKLQRQFAATRRALRIDEFDLRRENPTTRSAYRRERAEALWRVPVVEIETVIASGKLPTEARNKLATVVADVEELRRGSTSVKETITLWRRPLVGKELKAALVTALIIVGAFVLLLIWQGV
ncbi:MAG TPA: hypothetical protein VK504_00645 [Vicinamibacterales bacterium]|nr:hypothetical protein [Vicinamibacterales bacterium]